MMNEYSITFHFWKRFSWLPCLRHMFYSSAHADNGPYWQRIILKESNDFHLFRQFSKNHFWQYILRRDWERKREMDLCKCKRCDYQLKGRLEGGEMPLGFFYSAEFKEIITSDVIRFPFFFLFFLYSLKLRLLTQEEIAYITQNV